MLASFTYLIPQHLSTVLFAVASAEPNAIAQKLRFTLKTSLYVGVPASIVLALGARWELKLFGADYSRLATFPLVLLALGYLPCIPKVHYVAVCRAIGKVNRAAVVLTTFTVAEIAMAALGGYLHGLVGLSVALLIVAVVEGIATTPAVLKAANIIGSQRHSAAVNSANNYIKPIGTRDLPSESAIVPDGRGVRYRAYRTQQEAGLAAFLALAVAINTNQPFRHFQGPQVAVPPEVPRFVPKE
jgi:hypothetical protein